jgi:hypothetical protein
VPLDIGGIAGRDSGDTIVRSPRAQDESRFIHVTKDIRLGWAFDKTIIIPGLYHGHFCVFGAGRHGFEQLPEISDGYV